MKSTVTSYGLFEFREHLIRSKKVAEVFNIKVLKPVSDSCNCFPVLYATDSDELFGGLATLANGLQGSGETTPFILVGIGYERSRLAELLRMRDLLPRSIRVRVHSVVQSLANSMTDDALDHMHEVMQTTDAHEFLEFLREELIPFINEHYPALPNSSSYFGYSAGATFGLYTLFAKAETFDRYILGSPSTSYDNHHFGIELAREFVASGRTLEAEVFMSVGEFEEFRPGGEKFDLVTGFYRMVKYLRSTSIPRLKLTARVFPGETHATAWSPAFSHGLRTLFRPNDQSHVTCGLA
jgi:predicted alpha/beta superfamily hydrolase